MEEAKGIEYGTFPGCVGADEKVKVAKIDACIVETAIVFRRKLQELHLLMQPRIANFGTVSAAILITMVQEG